MTGMLFRAGSGGAVRGGVVAVVAFAAAAVGPRPVLGGQQSPLSRSPTVLVRIDAGSSNFSYFTRFAAASDGRLAVAQAQDGEVRLFAADGRPLATAGTRGAGPGEFRALNALGWAGDSLWVADYVTSRVTVLSSRGRLLSTTPIPVSLTGSGGRPTVRSPRLLGRFPDGSLLLRGQSRGSPVPGVSGEVVELERWMVRARVDGTVIREITKLGQDHCQRRAPTAELRLPLCPQPLTEVATDGSAIASVFMDVSGASTSSYTLVVISPSGDTTFTRRQPVVVEAAPRSLRDSLTKELARADPPLRVLSKGYRVPEFYPPVTTLVVGSSGDIWVGLRPHEGADLREWHVFDRLGKSQVTAWLPRAGATFAAEPRGMWTTSEREDGLEDIVLYARPRP